MDALIALAEHGWVPDPLLRLAVRRLLRQRLAQCRRDAGAERAFVESLRSGPVALVPELANQQHYEVPAAFFECVLGPNRKYSCCQFDAASATLAEAEAATLMLVCERARIQDGMRVLELGCGWGSLSLWMARHYPNCRVTAVSNSHSQREFIERTCVEAGLENLHVVTCDMNAFETQERFDRIVSIEMFEHMRNWWELLRRVSKWLLPEGYCFIHIFCHRVHSYPFEDKGASDWMARNFFTGGIMPSARLIEEFQEDMVLEETWRVDGRHYARTAEAWLRNLDLNRLEATAILAGTYGAADARIWLQRWRMFFLACAELFGYGGGDEWHVCHYLLRHLAPKR